MIIGALKFDFRNESKIISIYFAHCDRPPIFLPAPKSMYSITNFFVRSPFPRTIRREYYVKVRKNVSVYTSC